MTSDEKYKLLDEKFDKNMDSTYFDRSFIAWDIDTQLGIGLDNDINKIYFYDAEKHFDEKLYLPKFSYLNIVAFDTIIYRLDTDIQAFFIFNLDLFN